MRLVDLHCDWLRQYATETTLHDPGLYPEIPGRVGRLDGFLLGTSLAVLACVRKAEDWARQPDSWHSLGLMIARYESEFTGRILYNADDVARWRSWPADGLCWGVIGVAGFECLIRADGDLDRLPALFERGVRVFQPVATTGGVLGGSTGDGDDRGLTDLGRGFVARVAGLGRGNETGPWPILDLAGMNGRTMAETLKWLDDEPGVSRGLLLTVSHGTAGYASLLDGSSVDGRNLGEFRARGGVIGLTPGQPGCETPDDLKRCIETIAALPYEGRPGYAGIAIGTDLLGLEQTAPGLGSAREIIRWLKRAFDARTAAELGEGNALRLLLRSTGIKPEDSEGEIESSPEVSQ